MLEFHILSFKLGIIALGNLKLISELKEASSPRYIRYQNILSEQKMQTFHPGPDPIKIFSA